MTNVDNFKFFVKKNPKLVNYVRDNTMSWQSFYELYDLYGEDNVIWDKYLKEETRSVTSNNNNNTSSGLSNIMNMAKNMDVNKLQDGINSIQKAINLFGDIILKNDSTPSSTYTPRPIYRKFDD